MRILLAAKMMDVGGIERCIVALARELQRREHAVWVVSSGGHLVAELERSGATHAYAPMEITSPIAMRDSATVIRRIVREQRIDLVHSFSATAALAVNLALRPWIRRVERNHNGNGHHKLVPDPRRVSSPMGLQNSPRELAITTWLRNWFISLGAERILVISPEIRRHLKAVGVPDDQLIDFNFVGLDVESFNRHPLDHASVRDEFGFPEDALIVSTIGALHPRKSHGLFVDAAARVAGAIPEARFLIIGGGELRQELEHHALERRLDGRLVFTGVRDDIPRLLSATDVYVKPGVLEGFIGITVLEALSLSKPVVAFETEDVKLALTDGITGIVVPNGDTAALADSIIYLLQHPSVGAELGAAGHQLVTERFHFGLLAQRLEQFYADLLAQQAAPAIVARP
jgi:glycosyltransferase involved in cell wall biosynthesis